MGPFNTFGHETEPIAQEASALLMQGVAALFSSLGDLERGNLSAEKTVKRRC